MIFKRYSNVTTHFCMAHQQFKWWYKWKFSRIFIRRRGISKKSNESAMNFSKKSTRLFQWEFSVIIIAVFFASNIVKSANFQCLIFYSLLSYLHSYLEKILSSFCIVVSEHIPLINYDCLRVVWRVFPLFGLERFNWSFLWAYVAFHLILNHQRKWLWLSGSFRRFSFYSYDLVSFSVNLLR